MQGDARVLTEFVQQRWLAAPRQVVGACTHDPRVGRQRSGHQGRVTYRSDSDGDIDAQPGNVHDAVRQRQVDAQCRIVLHQGWQQRHDDGLTKHAGCCDSQYATGCTGIGFQRRAGGFAGVQHGFGVRQKHFALRRQ